MTMSEIFDGPAASAAEKSRKKGGRERGRARVRPMVTEGDIGVAVKVRAAGAIVADDLRSAWLWQSAGPTPAQLWATRIPAIDRVPGENKALHAAWVGYNHAALAVLFPLMFAFWVACHPARLLYALPIAAPIAALWLI